MESVTTGRKLPCGHDLCTTCAREWLRSHTTCPFCRANVPGGRTTEVRVAAVPEVEPVRVDFDGEMELMFQMALFRSVIEF
jgi:hypothetical protein